MKSGSYSKKIPISQFVPWKHKHPFPSNLDMELTERCNNNCSHCYINLPADDTRARNLEFGFEQIKLILEEAACLGCRSIRLTGGEPLIRDDFQEIYLLAKKLGLKVKIFTNGTLITPYLANIFSRIPPGNPIQVSLYGWNRKTYEAISHTPGSFEAVKRGIDLLRTHEIPFVVNTVVLPLKRGTFIEFEKWMQSVPELNIPRPKVLSLHLNCRGTDVRRNRRIRAFRIGPQQQLELEARQPEAYINDLEKFCSKFCHLAGDTLFGCSAGIGRGCIDAYGKLQPCLLLRHPDTTYDLKTGSLIEGFQEFFPRVRKLTAKNPLYLERCAKCFLIDLCEQCPAVSWMENQVLDGWPEHFCNFSHAQARFIGLLREGEKSWMVSDWKERILHLNHSDIAIPSKQKTTVSKRSLKRRQL